MKSKGLTKWGAFLVGIRGLCLGVWLGVALRGYTASVSDQVLVQIALAIWILSRVITPALRALGWRGLKAHFGDGAQSPGHREVERALRSLLSQGLSLPEAIRYLRLSHGWDVLLVYPAVASVAGMPVNEAIRMVMLATKEHDPSVSEAHLRANQSLVSARG